MSTLSTEMLRSKLFFGKGNAKLDEAIFTFSLPAGHACPFAEACWSRANRDTGTIKDGPRTIFRCYAASMEVRPSVRRSRWRNLQALRACKTQDETVNLILVLHSPGSPATSASTTRAISLARKSLTRGSMSPRSVIRPFSTFTRSRSAFWASGAGFGGGWAYGWRRGELYTDRQLRRQRRPSHRREWAAVGPRRVVRERGRSTRSSLRPRRQSGCDPTAPDFSLLIHGSQPAGTPAAKAVAALRAQGEYGYGERAAAIRASRLLRAKAE